MLLLKAWFHPLLAVSWGEEEVPLLEIMLKCLLETGCYLSVPAPGLPRLCCTPEKPVGSTF